MLLMSTNHANGISYMTSAAIGVLGVCFLGRKMVRTYRESTRDNPPTSSRSIVGTMVEMGGNRLPFFYLEMSRICGSMIFRLNIPLMRIFVVGDFKAVREILLESDKPTNVYNVADYITGRPSIFSRSSMDSKWTAARKGCSPAFSSREVKRMDQVCNKKLQEWISRVLDPCILKNGTFDPSKEMTKLTFSIILESAFEYEKVTENEYSEYSREVELCLREFSLRYASNPLRKLYSRFTAEGRRAFLAAQRVRAFSQKILDSYRTKQDKAKENTLIKLIDSIPGFDDAQKVAEISLFLIAGHDTTGYTVGTTLIQAAKHPDEALKVRASVEEVGGRFSDYLNCFVSECNRLLPVTAAGSIRHAGRDFVFSTASGKVRIARGSTMIMPQILANRDAEVYERADQFLPERWLNPTEDMKLSRLMFSLGQRNCIGQALAMAEIRSVLPALLSRYCFEIDEEGHLDFFLTLKYSGCRIKPKHATVSQG